MGDWDSMYGGTIFNSLHRKSARLLRNSPNFHRLETTVQRIVYAFRGMSWERRADNGAEISRTSWYGRRVLLWRVVTDFGIRVERI